MQRLAIVADAYRPRSEKDVGFPPVLLLALDVGGAYFRPRRARGEEVAFGEVVVTVDDRGLILVADHGDADSSIAHEWCHHLQFHRGRLSGPVAWPPIAGTYRQQIVAYFSSSRAEEEAMRYEIDRVGGGWPRTWIDWLETARSATAPARPTGRPGVAEPVRQAPKALCGPILPLGGVPTPGWRSLYRLEVPTFRRDAYPPGGKFLG